MSPARRIFEHRRATVRMPSIRDTLYGKEKRPIGEFRWPRPDRIRQVSKASTAVSTANWRFDLLNRSSYGRLESNPQWEASQEIVTLPEV